MGKRYKEKQLAAQAGRRRAVLQIDRVSRREVNEVPTVRVAPTKREVNPNSVTGIGLLGVYGENSSDEEEEQELPLTDAAVGSSVPDDNENQPHQEMDAKLADFFKEIESIDPDTAPSSTVGHDVSGSQLPQDGFSSTSECGPNETQAYDATNGDADEQGAEVQYPWQMCFDENTNCYYYWNTETNEVRWEPPSPLPPDSDVTTRYAANDDGEDKEASEETSVQYGPTFPDNHDTEMEDRQSVVGPSLPPEKSEKDLKDEEETLATSSGQALVEYQDTEENQYPGTPPDSQSDDNMDGYEVVDTWEGDEQSGDTIDGRPLDDAVVTEDSDKTKEITCEKQSIDDEQDSDDEFAAMLLEEGSEGDNEYRGVKEVVKDEMALPVTEQQNEDEEASSPAGSEDSQRETLLPPSVFEHLKASSTTDKTVNTKEVKAEEQSGLSAAAQEDDGDEEKFRQKILDLSATITNKLDFLEISRDGITNLQILCIEMETRIKDWREGGLTSGYLIRKLEEANLHFKQYEESAAPPGWTCKWHRSHKRYFYTNNADGESQWDYPLVSGTETKEEAKSTTASAVTTSSLAEPVMVTAQPSMTPVATVAVTTASATSSTAVVRTVSMPAWGSTAQVYAPTIPSVAMPVHGSIQAAVMDYSMQPGLPLVSTVPAAAIYHNPPVPGADSSVEAVPFSLRTVTEEPPPPPPGTDEPPPLPSGDLPPPPPPEPDDEKPPPPPGEETTVTNFSSVRTVSTTVVSTSISAVSSSTTISTPPNLFPTRSLIDYSDLDGYCPSPPPSTVTGLSGEMVASFQPTGNEQVSSGQGSGTSSPVPMNVVGATKSKTKRKKSSKLGSTLSSKARKVSSLVQKWQSIQVEEPEIESEEEEEINPDVVSQKQIEQWKMEHVTSGQAAYNPNFEEVKGDWRERLLKKKQKTGD